MQSLNKIHGESAKTITDMVLNKTNDAQSVLDDLEDFPKLDCLSLQSEM